MRQGNGSSGEGAQVMLRPFYLHNSLRNYAYSTVTAKTQNLKL